MTTQSIESQNRLRIAQVEDNAGVSQIPLRPHHIIILCLLRLVLTTACRVVYPLLPLLAVVFKLDLKDASLIMTACGGAVILSPIGGLLGDKFGKLPLIRLALILFCAGLVICLYFNDFTHFLIGYILIGLATAFFIPIAQAYVSSAVPYEKSGRVLAILEIPWALSALIGVSTLCTMVSAVHSVKPAFGVLLVLGVVSFFITLLLPSDHQRIDTRSNVSIPKLAHKSIIGAIAMIVCLMSGYEIIFVVYGSWVQSSFHANTQQLGTLFAMIGIAELTGSIGAALLIDRVGKRRSVLFGLPIVATLEVLLALTAGNWPLLLVTLFFFVLCFEFAIIAAFSLISGITTQARGTVLALAVASIGVGKACGSVTGAPIFETWGFAANGMLASCLTIAALLCLIFIRQRNESR